MNDLTIHLFEEESVVRTNMDDKSLMKIFARTSWQHGAWKRALLNLEGAEIDQHSRHYAGHNSRGIILPDQYFLKNCAQAA